MGKSKELETGISAVEEAGKILLQNLGSQKIVKLKEKADISTDSDLESEKAIIEVIEKEFPNHNILAEETGKKEKGSQSTWIVDSLDGTKNYFKKTAAFQRFNRACKEERACIGRCL
jgi:myo-inositol-1(or 4)-monophosphatase